MKKLDSIKLLIFFHACLGGIALMLGPIATTITKGSKAHKRSATILHHSMVMTVFMYIFIALIPSHFKPILLRRGIFINS